MRADQKGHHPDQADLLAKQASIAQDVNGPDRYVRNHADVFDLNAVFRVVEIISDEDWLAIDGKDERSMAAACPGDPVWHAGKQRVEIAEVVNIAVGLNGVAPARPDKQGIEAGSLSSLRSSLLASLELGCFDGG